MEITIQKDRVLVFKDKLKQPEAESIAWQNKQKAFGGMAQFASFLGKPKDDDYELISKEKSYLPFWHIVGKSSYEYERKVTHKWFATGPEVKDLKLENKDYEVKDGAFEATVIEHCVEQSQTDICIDGLTDREDSSLKSYLEFAYDDTDKEFLEKLARDANIAIPLSRSSAIIREASSKMIKNIQADKIFEETLVLKNVDLYYRPVYTFTYRQVSKAKDARINIDGLTEQVSFNEKNLTKLVSKLTDYDFLFDIGSDAAGTLIPGGGIAVKFAKKIIDSKKNK